MDVDTCGAEDELSGSVCRLTKKVHADHRDEHDGVTILWKNHEYKAPPPPEVHGPPEPSPENMGYGYCFWGVG